MKRLFLILFLLTNLSHAETGTAKDITPKFVFKTVLSIKNELKLVLLASDEPLPKPLIKATIKKEPRHLLQLSQQILAALHYLIQPEYADIYEEKFPKGDRAQLSEVAVTLNKIIHLVKSIKPNTPTENHIPTNSPGKEKTITDSYNMLMQVLSIINSLNGSPPLPLENYQMMTGVVENIKAIRKQKKITTPIPEIARDNNKTPTDVYNAAYKLLEKIKKLSKKPTYQIPGGVILPNYKKGRKIPADSLPIIGQIKAETTSIKRKLNPENQMVMQNSSALETPPGVYRQVEKAIALVDTLL